jgi:hypothetical protein
VLPYDEITLHRLEYLHALIEQLRGWTFESKETSQNLLFLSEQIEKQTDTDWIRQLPIRLTAF